jgi:hypothetical protein
MPFPFSATDGPPVNIALYQREHPFDRLAEQLIG